MTDSFTYLVFYFYRLKFFSISSFCSYMLTVQWSVYICKYIFPSKVIREKRKFLMKIRFSFNSSLKSLFFLSENFRNKNHNQVSHLGKYIFWICDFVGFWAVIYFSCCQNFRPETYPMYYFELYGDFNTELFSDCDCSLGFPCIFRTVSIHHMFVIPPIPKICLLFQSYLLQFLKCLNFEIKNFKGIL